VVLPFEEFQQREEELADYHDLLELRAARLVEGDAPTLTLAAAKEELGLD
jgi:hypothetical protein